MFWDSLRYETNFQCSCSSQTAITRILNAVSDPYNGLKLVRMSHSGTQKIVLRANSDSMVFVNSFMPLVEIDISESGSNALISMKFKLQKYIKVFDIIYFIFCLIMQVGILVAYLIRQLTFDFTDFLPLCMLLFIYVFNVFGLKSSSKWVVEVLFYKITEECETQVPTISRC